MKSNTFFSSSNVYPAIWAIIVGLLGFFGGIIWKHYSGPDKVLIVNNQEHSIDTSLTIIQFQPDERYFESINKIASQQIRNQYKTNPIPKKEVNIDSLALIIANDYQSKFDSLILSYNSNDPTIHISDSVEYNTAYNGPRNLIKLQRPKYRMPSIVEGYKQGKLYSIANCNINSLVFNKGDLISISIDILNKEYLSKITPLFIDIVTEEGPNSYYQIWSEQYAIVGTLNLLQFPADFKQGKYKLSIGFYFTDELDTKYPTFYVKSFNVEIV